LGSKLTVEVEHASDIDLARQAGSGDELAFEEIVRRYGPRVFRIAGRFFRQRSAVEEISQEVFLRAYTQLGTYEGRGSFEGWISRIATNTCLNEIRKAKRHPEFYAADLTDDEENWLETRLAGSSLSDDYFERGIIAADLADKVLGSIAPEDRIILIMLDGEDLPVREVCEITGWSQSKVKIRAMRARRKVRKTVERMINSRRKPAKGRPR
jgi:RNA polymerase sigma-70 factor (ECF subfamily)